MLTIVPLYAQQKFQPELAVGIRGGYQFSRITFDPVPPQQLNQGYTAGLILQYLSQAQLGIQLEINYSQRGWAAPDIGAPLEFKRDQDYLEIPLLTHFAIGKKNFRFVINAGSYVSYLIDNRFTFLGPGEAQPYYYLPTDNKWGFGLAGGLGLALRSGIGVIQLEARGALGLTDLYSPSNQDIFNTSTEQFFGGQLSYLYRFQNSKNKE